MTPSEVQAACATAIAAIDRIIASQALAAHTESLQRAGCEQRAARARALALKNVSTAATAIRLGAPVETVTAALTEAADAYEESGA